MADFADDDIELSIVMPCLNEAETLERCIVKAKSFIDTHKVRAEILIGDNGSTDGSQQIAERCGARVVDVPVRGYGAALHHAILAVRGKYVILADSDDSYDFTALAPFLDALRGGAELVMGNRFKGGIREGAMPWKNRYIGNPVLSGVGRLFFRAPVGDFHCGMRGLATAAYRKLDLRTTGMEYASEMVIKATLARLKIVEVPTVLHPDGRGRSPHLRPWRDGWRHLRFMLLYSPRWLFFYPGLALMVVGAGAGAWLMPGPRHVGGVTFDVHTLLFAALFLLLGFQAVVFAILAKVFAAREGIKPHPSEWDVWIDRISLEWGLFAGGILLAAGAAGSIGAVLAWRAEAFGDLDPARMLRWVIPAIVAVMLGCQTILASFFLGVLTTRTR